MKTDNANRLADRGKSICQVSRELKKIMLPGGGHLDYRWEAKNLIRPSPYSCVTLRSETSNNYFSSYHVNKCSKLTMLNKEFIKKSTRPTKPRFRSHTKTGNAERLADPRNLYRAYHVSREF